MRQTSLRTAAALVLILPALATNAAAQEKRNQGGGGGAPAVHAAPPPPAPHIAAPPPTPHISAPAQPHIVAQPQTVQQPHIAAQPHIVAQPHIAAQPHVAAQPHIAAPTHVATPQIAHTNVDHAIARQHGNAAITTAGEAARRGGRTPNVANSKVVAPNNTNAAVSGQNKAGPNKTEAIKTQANKTGTGTPASKLAAPNTATPGSPNVIGQGPDNRGRNTVNKNGGNKAVNQPTLANAQAQARAQIYASRKPILKNPAFANPALANASARNPAMRALARTTFQGRFAEFRGRDRFEDRRRFRGIVIGWVGPVFWPYAYEDFVDYTFWPYANDTFWPYAYDDVYDSMFGAYAPYASAYADYPGGRRRVRQYANAPAGLPGPGAAEVCSGEATGLTDWPIEQIAAQVQPTDQQRMLLDQLKDATAKAVNLLQSACPTDLPSTPTGRLAAMRQRIMSMLQAVQIVRPALDRFYQSLSDEQKERFIALEGETAPKSARTASRQQPNLAQACGGSGKQITGLPINQIRQVLRPDEAQQAALDELNNATIQAASALKESCAPEPQNQPITPPARLAAMEARLNALLKAVDTVQPAMAKFYNSLTDEQKARFDRLGPRTA